MTDDEMLAWGRMEFHTRLKQLEAHTPEGLRSAQRQAEQRAKDAGLSANDIAFAIMNARREWRKAALQENRDV